MKMKIVVLLLVAAALSVSADAGTIPIPNAGFEERANFDPFPESTDKYVQYIKESWRQFEVTNNGGPIRIWNPGLAGVDDTTQGVIDTGFGGVAPEGDYVIVVRTRYNDPDRDFEGAAQILEGTSFDPAQTYTLSAMVGRPGGSINTVTDYHGYALQIAVGGTNVDGSSYAGSVFGGTVIVTDVSADVPLEGFVRASATYTPDPSVDLSALAGLPLQIRLLALENNVFHHDSTDYVAFDDVTLVPEPMTLALLGFGGLMLRRRK